MRPKSEDVLKVINNFREVLHLAQGERKLNMHQDKVWACQTSFCHGGWYAMATMNPLKLFFLPFTADYEDGACKMAQDLGFGDGQELRTWAHRNPDIWGNAQGSNMFGASYAFFHREKRPDGATCLNDIVDHWHDVYERIKALEIAEENKYPDITKELAVLPVEERADQKVRETVTH
jgi:hypothetical protein